MATNTCPFCGVTSENNISANTAITALCPIHKFPQEGTMPPLINQPNNTGWLCPRCQKVHSPYSTTCDCKPQTVTSGNTNIVLVNTNPSFGGNPLQHSNQTRIGTYCEKCRQVVCTCKKKSE